MDSSEKRGAEFYPPEEADEQPWNDLPDSPRNSGQPPPGPEGPAPAPPSAGTARTVPPLAYLVALLAAGFLLITAACVLQLRDSQRELDEVRGALENVQAAEQLQEEKAQLQERVDGLTAAAEEAAQEMEKLRDQLQRKEYEASSSGAKKDMLNYLWFIQNFMESGDYAMAANAIAYGGNDAYVELNLNYPHALNRRQQEQYEGCRQQLIELGYLRDPGSPSIYYSAPAGSNVEPGRQRMGEIEQWGELWLGLRGYYINDSIIVAAAYLISWNREHQELVEPNRGSFAIDQYELLKETLISWGWLIETESGELDYSEPDYYGPVVSGSGSWTPD